MNSRGGTRREKCLAGRNRLLGYVFCFKEKIPVTDSDGTRPEEEEEEEQECYASVYLSEAQSAGARRPVFAELWLRETPYK